MTNMLRLGAAASLAAVACGIASPAFAAQTTAGSSITNNVSVTYKVGGITQNAVTASDTFTVDRKVNLTVVQSGTSPTVSPGQTQAVTTFLVSNLSNAPIDIKLDATNLTGDNYDVSNQKVYLDTDNSGTFNAGDTLVTYLDQVAAETSGIRVFVVSDIPLGQTTGQVANVRLAGTAYEATAAGSLGAIITQTTTANTSGMDTVFADTNTSGGNTARDGIDFAQDSYTILAAAISATKTSRIVSDPLNGTTNPKAIPGATIEYCIAVTNGGGATASSVAIADTLPTTTTYDSTFGVKVDGSVTSGTCNADGGTAGSYASGAVSGTISTLPASTTKTVLFRVTIN